MAEEGKQSRVCVTNGVGFIGSWLVKKLLEGGYTVHATLRSIGDEKKVGMLQWLVLFQADLSDLATFVPTIAGCQFVFLVATPSAHEAVNSKYKSMAEALPSSRGRSRKASTSSRG